MKITECNPIGMIYKGRPKNMCGDGWFKEIKSEELDISQQRQRSVL
jgi:hypothetical protein